MALSFQEWLQQLAQTNPNIAGSDFEAVIGPMYQQYLQNPDTWQPPREATQAEADALRAQWGTWAPVIANLQAQGFTDIQRDDTRITPTSTSIFTGINPQTGQRESIGTQGSHDPITSNERFNTAVAALASMGLGAVVGAYGTAAGVGGLGAAEATDNAATGTTTASTATPAVANTGPETTGVGGELFGPGAADTLDASLIGPNAGAAVGSESVFAPAVVPASAATPAAAVPAAATAGGGSSGNSVDSPAPTSGSNTTGNVLSDLSGLSPEMIRILGALGVTGLGVAGSINQTNALKELAAQQMAIGAPSRERYEASFSPDFKVTDIPGYSDALDTSWQTMLRKLSATGGNPYGNPGGITEANKYIYGSVALPAIQNYRTQNANTGGYSSFNTAAPTTATNAIGSQGNIYNAVGAGIADVTQPRRQVNLTDLYRSLA